MDNGFAFLSLIRRVKSGASEKKHDCAFVAAAAIVSSIMKTQRAILRLMERRRWKRVEEPDTLAMAFHRSRLFVLFNSLDTFWAVFTHELFALPSLSSLD